MVEQLKQSKRFGIILMKGGKEFPEHWENHLRNLGYAVHKINEKPRTLFAGELLNRWYPGIRRSLEGMAGRVNEIAEITGISPTEINKVIELKDKTHFTIDEENMFRRFVEKLAEHKNKLFERGIEDAHTLITSYVYMNRPVQWILLERNAERKDIMSKLGLNESIVKDLLKGKDYNEVVEQDFIKTVVVGATNMRKAHKGSLRNLAIKEIDEKGISNVLNLEENDFYPFIQNVVHCPWAEELDVDLNLLTEEEKRRIKEIIS